MKVISGFSSISELKEIVSKGVSGIFIPSWIDNLNEVFRILKDYNGIICTDNEGGYASWVVKGYPSAMEVSEMAEDELSYGRIYQTYLNMALKLKSLGINMNLAPVIDLIHEENEVIHKKQRAFSDDPYKVIAIAELFIHAHRTAGVEVVLKHFVGQGRASGDPHTGMSIYKLPWEELMKDLKPFIHFISKGVNYIMLSHVIVPYFDELPISLSKKWVNFIRNTLGFRGFLISDDIYMKAILEHFGIEEALSLMESAGVDYVIMSKGLKGQNEQ